MTSVFGMIFASFIKRAGTRLKPVEAIESWGKERACHGIIQHKTYDEEIRTRNLAEANVSSVSRTMAYFRPFECETQRRRRLAN